MLEPSRYLGSDTNRECLYDWESMMTKTAGKEKRRLGPGFCRSGHSLQLWPESFSLGGGGGRVVHPICHDVFRTGDLV